MLVLPPAQYVVMRLDRTGKLIGKMAIPLSKHQAKIEQFDLFWVAAQGSDFLVGGSYESRANVYRVSPDGNVAWIGGDPQFATAPACVEAGGSLE